MRKLARGWPIAVAIFGVVLGLVLVGAGTILLIQENNAPAVVSAPTATGAASPTVKGTPTRGPLPAGDDWAQYRSDIGGTGVNHETSITPANVASLAPVWTVDHSQGYFGTPAVVDGVVYAATGLSLYAYDLQTGKALWHLDFNAEQNGGIHASVAVDPAKKLAFVSTPETNLYAVNISTHKLVWHQQEGDPTRGAFGWSSPLVVNGKVYIGLASNNDNPCVRGAVQAYDEATGRRIWTHYTENAGEIGAGVWSSVTAVPAAKLILATTGNPCLSTNANAQEDAIVALNWDTGATVWKYTALAYDDCDCDFGQGAVPFTYQGTNYVSAGNKYGVMYTVKLDANWQNPKLAWSRRVAATDTGENGGGIFTPPAYDDGLIFVATGHPSDGSCNFGAFYALKADTGAVVWRACTHGTSRTYSATAVIGDLVFSAQATAVVAYDRTTGKEAWNVATPPAYGGVAISRGYVLVPVVTGHLIAYSLPVGTHTTAG